MRSPAARAEIAVVALAATTALFFALAGEDGGGGAPEHAELKDKR